MKLSGMVLQAKVAYFPESILKDTPSLCLSLECPEISLHDRSIPIEF